MRQLTCGCCGCWFDGEPDPSHDTGFGDCPRCAADMRADNERRLADLRGKIATALNPKNRAKYLAMDQDLQNALVWKAIDDGKFKWTIRASEPVDILTMGDA